MNKKAQTIKYVIALILGLLIIFVISSYIWRSNKIFSSSISPLQAQELDRSCALSGESAALAGKKFSDHDEDGYPDFCDICVDVDNAIDSDGDYMPDGCELESTVNDATSIKCKWKEAKGNRCASVKVDYVLNLKEGKS